MLRTRPPVDDGLAGRWVSVHGANPRARAHYQSLQAAASLWRRRLRRGVHGSEEVERIAATRSLNEGSEGVVMRPRIDVHGHRWIINRQTATRICAGLPKAPQTAVSIIVEDDAEQRRWDENRVASTITKDGHDGLIGSSSCRVQETLNGGRRDGRMVGRMKQHRCAGIDAHSCPQAEPN